MKYLFISFLALSIVSCEKDKVPAIVDSNCPTTVSFNNEVLPIFQTNCVSCHSTGNTSPTLEDYTTISTNADAALASLHGTPSLMPRDQNGTPFSLPDSVIQKVQCWINQGKKNN